MVLGVRGVAIQLRLAPARAAPCRGSGLRRPVRAPLRTAGGRARRAAARFHEVAFVKVDLLELTGDLRADGDRRVRLDVADGGDIDRDVFLGDLRGHDRCVAAPPPRPPRPPPPLPGAAAEVLLPQAAARMASPPRPAKMVNRRTWPEQIRRKRFNTGLGSSVRGVPDIVHQHTGTPPRPFTRGCHLMSLYRVFSAPPKYHDFRRLASATRPEMPRLLRRYRGRVAEVSGAAHRQRDLGLFSGRNRARRSPGSGGATGDLAGRLPTVSERSSP